MIVKRTQRDSVLFVEFFWHVWRKHSAHWFPTHKIVIETIFCVGGQLFVSSFQDDVILSWNYDTRNWQPEGAAEQNCRLLIGV